jgi:hypothetical protein
VTRSRHDPHQRARELRAVLECTSADERTVEAARRLIAERDTLRRKVTELESALVLARRQSAHAGLADAVSAELAAAVQECGDGEEREAATITMARRCGLRRAL